MGTENVTIPQRNFTNELSQIYQGVANTAGPYFNLAAALQPGYGQIGLSNLQQQLFGYNTPAPGVIGGPATPPGGWIGNGTYGAPAAQPAMGPTPAGATGATPVTGAGLSFNPYGAPSTGDPSTGGYAGVTPYSPAQGTLIGLGKDNAFNDPYAGSVGPAFDNTGYNPGVLDLNTSALRTFGPYVSEALLGSNPYLADALSMQNNAAYEASIPTNLQIGLNQSALQGGSPLLQFLNQSGQNGNGLLDTLNTNAQAGLDSQGRLSTEQQNILDQQTLGLLSSGGQTHGNSAIAAQLFGRQSAIDQRVAAAQQFAQQVQTANQAQNQFGLGVESANQAQNQFGLGVQQANIAQTGLAGQLAAQAAQSSGVLTNAGLQVLGLGNLNANANPSTSITDQNAMFNPFQQMGASVFDYNANAAASTATANANAAAQDQANYMQLIGDGLSAWSDRRIKTGLVKAGKSPSGIQEWEWQFTTDNQNRTYHGAVAQEVEQTHPEAVGTDQVSGMKWINYSKIDVPFYQVT